MFNHKDKVVSFAGTWMGLESITVGEISQTRKDKRGVFLGGVGRLMQKEVC